MEIPAGQTDMSTEFSEISTEPADVSTKFTDIPTKPTDVSTENSKESVEISTKTTRISTEKTKISWPCKICLKCFSCRSHMRRHIRVVHAEKKSPRDVNSANLGVDKEKTKSTPVSAKKSSEVFDEKSDAEKKMFKFKCTLCEKDFNHRSHMRRHIRIVHHEKNKNDKVLNETLSNKDQFPSGNQWLGLVSTEVSMKN